jgi:anaerobic magnesium-protoporphyrin IX monomethyl ester cyclase
MKVLLVRPPDPLQEVALLSHTKPLNLAYLASYLIARGVSVSLVDYEIESFTPATFREKLIALKPCLIGFSCMTPTIKNGFAMAAMAKQYDEAIITVAGGCHANALPLATMEEFPAFDFLIYGEGEETLWELCKRIQSTDAGFGDIGGLVYRDGRRVIQNAPRPLIEDLDSLPFPARDLLNYGEQKGHSVRGFSNKIRSAELFTSRGCPIGCTFCAIQATFGKKVRFHSVDRIRAELDQCISRFMVNHVIIADDTFSLNQKRAFEICDILGRSAITSWNCDTRVDTVSEDLLRAMRESRCQKVAFGVESGSQRILDIIGKKISIEQVHNALYWAKKAGLKHIEGNFIIGSDCSETIEDIEQTIKLIRELPWTFVSVTIIVPYPGTPVYDAMKSKGYIFSNDWEDFVMFGKNPRWRTDHFSSEDLLRLQKNITRRFYTRPWYITRQLMSIRSFTELSYWIKSGVSYLKWYFFGKV